MKIEMDTVVSTLYSTGGTQCSDLYHIDAHLAQILPSFVAKFYILGQTSQI